MKTKSGVYVLIALAIAYLGFELLSRHQREAARQREESVGKAAAQASAINDSALDYANSLMREDPDKSHVLLGGSGRPWILGTPYPSPGDVERVLGQPSLVDRTGAKIWLYRPVPRIDRSGTMIDGDSSKMLELWFDRDDSKLSRITIHQEGETTIGRNGRDYEKHWTYSVPTVR
jgi:hypothetical protein